MREPTQEYQDLQLRWLILLAVLINGSLLLFLFCMEMDTSIFVMPSFSSEREEPAPVVFDQLSPGNNQLQQPPPRGGIAALKPRASVFGATDIEQDEPEFMPGVTDSRTKSEDGSGTQLSYEKIKKRPKDIGIEESGNEQEQTNSAPASEHTKEATTPEQSAKKTDAENAPHDGMLPSELSKPTAEKATAPESIKQLGKRQTKKYATRNNTGMGTKNAGPIKRLPSLTDLAQGFIESFKNTGNDWFERDGDPNLRPDAHEFKYLSYSQKIYWHVQNVIKQNKIMGRHPQWPAQISVSMNLQFDREGTIKNIVLAQSSGHTDYDEYCLNIFKQNTDGYPPIPNHIPENTIMMPVVIILSADTPFVRFWYK